MKKKPIYNLTIYIIVSAILVCITGLIIKVTIGRNSLQLKDTPAIAAPFAVIRDKTIISPQKNESISFFGREGIIHGVSPLIKPEKPIEDNDADDAPPTPKEFHQVEDSYFDDALFIGDSRTVGLSQYGRLGNADYFADVGLSSFNVFSSTASDTNFGSTTLTSLLSSKTYGKVYVMLGINECGYPDETLYAQLDSVVYTIREYQPDAIIFVMANLRVSYSKSTTASYFSLDNINNLNEHLRSLSNDTDIFYIDANPLFCDENGYLKSDVTGDGTHIYGSQYPIWADFLKQNGI